MFLDKDLQTIVLAGKIPNLFFLVQGLHSCFWFKIFNLVLGGENFAGFGVNKYLARSMLPMHSASV